MDDFLTKISDISAYIPGIIFTFFTIFIVHELGHYWAARLRRMKVETFSVGFGRRLYAITDRHGTEWTFHMFPLGGHVRISDLTLDESTKSRRSIGTRLFVVLAGPGANLLLPFIIMPLCFLLIGLPSRPPIITAVEKGMPAVAAGLQNNDIVTHVNGHKIVNYDDLGNMVENSGGKTLSITLKRANDEITMAITPQLEEFKDLVNIHRELYKIGVLNALVPMSFNFIREINGENVEDLKSDEMRAKLQNVLGKQVELGIQGADDKTHYYDLIIPSELNDHFSDPDHRYKKALFLGPLKGNVFIHLDSWDAIKRGVQSGGDILWKMIKVPFQIFPIDPMLYAERIPFFPDSEYYYESLIYRTAFQTALLSILIAFVNLIPFPRLDGDFVLTYLMEAYLKKRPTRRQRAIAIVICLFTIYCTILFANLADLPGYIEIKMKEFQDRIEDWNDP